MPSLPPPVWAELHYDGAWNTATGLRTKTAITVTRGLTSESSSEAEPTTCTCALGNRDDRYSPRNPMSPLYGKIGRNTPFRWGYNIGSPWVELTTVENGLTTPGTGLAVSDLDLRLDIALEAWAGRDLAGRYLSTGDNRAWAVTVYETGQLVLYWSPDGTLASRTAVFSTVAVGAYNGQRLAIRVTLDVDNGAGGYEVRFYTGRTVDDDEWTLLGEPVVGATTTAVSNGTAELELGRVKGISGDAAAGKLYAFRLLDGIGGAVVASMDAADAAPDDDSFTSGGRVWTTVNAAFLTNRHVRMAGEVPAWPPTRDLSGNDNIVSIAPTGITRRMDAGNKPQDSALRRYIRARGALECWPLTDGVDSKTAKSMFGGRDMAVESGSLVRSPSWAAGTLADWIEPVVGVTQDMIGGLIGYTPRVPSVGIKWSVDVFLTGGAGNADYAFDIVDTGSGTDADPQRSIRMHLGGELQQVLIIRRSETTNASEEVFLGNYYGLNLFDDQPHALRVTVDIGPFPGVHLYVDGEEQVYVSLDVDVGPVSQIRLGWGFSTIAGETLTDRAVGYLTYWNYAGPTAAEVWDAYMGFQGESASARIERLAAEAGYTASVAGQVVYEQRMGIQGRAKLLALLNEASRTNFGYLLDARDRAEVIHRGGSTLWNQTPALVLDYSAGLISAPFRPVDDDKLTENDVSVKRRYGAVPARQVLEEGALSVQDPPNGVGRYDNEYTYSLATDGQADQVAGMRVHLGTYNGVRYTRITLNLANPRVFAMIDEILRTDVGDLIRLTRLPADHGPDDVDVLVHGYEETAGPDEWTITFNCRPGAPWTAGVVGSRRYGHVDVSGSQLAAAIDADATSVSLTSTEGSLWTSDPDDLPFDLKVGGETMTVTAVSAEAVVIDTFDRTVAEGWGTPDFGPPWTTDGGSASDYSVQGG
ncbi:hypothetical protein [Streptomyces sp. NPDC048392]|uniref:hypothetical protein n=1 Tax=Streptomyces sp. NPDC048392 TaxID=3365543 RepID=UPI0037168C4D